MVLNQTIDPGPVFPSNINVSRRGDMAHFPNLPTESLTRSRDGCQSVEKSGGLGRNSQSDRPRF